MRPLLVLLCIAAVCGVERFALVAGTGADATTAMDARSIALGLERAGFSVERCLDADALPAACERFAVRMLRGHAIGVLFYAGSATAEARTARLGGADGVDAGLLLERLAAAPHAASLLLLDAAPGEWAMLPAPAGCAVVLRPRPGAVPGRRLAELVQDHLLAPGRPCHAALVNLRRVEPSLAVDSKLPRPLVLAGPDPAPGPVEAGDEDLREVRRLYEGALRRDFAAAQALDARPDVAPGIRIRSWLAFLAAFRFDLPGSDEDERCRAAAVRALAALGRENPTAGELAPPPIPFRDLAGDPLPDMRWVFERAVRINRNPQAEKPERIRAWAAVLRLYPEDEPGTDNDDIWRMIAETALAELGAPHAGRRPPALPAGAPPPPAEPLMALLLGVSVTERGGGHPGLRIGQADVTAAALGLGAGDELLAADGQMLVRAIDLDAALQRGYATGSQVLALADQRRLTLRFPRESGAPAELAGLAASGIALDGGAEVRLPLPGGERVWFLAIDAAFPREVRIDGRPVAGGFQADGAWTAFWEADGPATVSIARRQAQGGSWAGNATPLTIRTAAASLRAGNAWSASVRVPVVPGEPLWIEAAAGIELELEARDPDGSRLWSDPLPARPGAAQRRVIRCAGRRAEGAEQAIATGGFATVTVRGVHQVDGEVRWRVGRALAWEWR